MTATEWTSGKRNGAVLLERREFGSHPPDRLDGVVTLVPLDQVDGDPRNPRHDLGDVDALAQSIAQFGILQPLLLRPVGNRYSVVSGHRRLAAVRQLQQTDQHDPRWRHVAAIIRRPDDETAYAMLVAAQTHLTTWKPAEEARALHRLRDVGLNLAQIAAIFGRTESWCSKRLRVHSDDVLAGYVSAGGLAVATAEELLAVKDAGQRCELAAQAASQQWSQAEARRAVRELLEGGSVVPTLKRCLEPCDNVVFSAAGTPLDYELVQMLEQHRRHIEELLATSREQSAEIAR